jgi:hypothetical protein
MGYQQKINFSFLFLFYTSHYQPVPQLPPQMLSDLPTFSALMVFTVPFQWVESENLYASYKLSWTSGKCPFAWYILHISSENWNAECVTTLLSGPGNIARLWNSITLIYHTHSELGHAELGAASTWKLSVLGLCKFPVNRDFWIIQCKMSQLLPYHGPSIKTKSWQWQMKRWEQL